MDAKTAIANVPEALTALRKSGQEFVSIDALFDYLSRLEQAAPDCVETKKLQHDSNFAHYRAVHESNLEMFKLTVLNRPGFPGGFLS